MGALVVLWCPASTCRWCPLPLPGLGLGAELAAVDAGALHLEAGEAGAEWEAE